MATPKGYQMDGAEKLPDEEVIPLPETEVEELSIPSIPVLQTVSPSSEKPKEFEQQKLLDPLKELQSLKELEKLKLLANLEKLALLDRLDQIKDFHAVEKTPRSLKRQILGVGLEAGKFLLAMVTVVFLLTRESGRDIVNKALPAIGFGQGAQVNLGLKLLVGETSPEVFQGLVKDVQSRIRSEAETTFSFDSILPLRRRVEMLDHLQSYSFKGDGIDLAAETSALIRTKFKISETEAISRLEFSRELAKSKGNSKLEVLLRDIHSLLKQKQYPQLLEKALPLWDENEALNMATIVGTLALKLEDPGTLDDIMRRQSPGFKRKPQR